MSGPHTNKNYTAADIERYHNGTMPAEEAHALERAALDDPFLSDAIDGYVHTATPAADVAFLKQQLQSRSGKVIAIANRNRSLWLRVAAMVVIVTGFGWMVYKLSGKMEHDIAATDAAPQPKAQSIPQQTTVDSVAAGIEESAATTQMRNEDKEKEAAKKGMTTTEAPETGNREAVSSSSVAADTAAVLEAQEAAPLSMKAMAKQAPAHTFKARVIDTTGTPVPFATITQAGTQNTTQADAIGAFSLPASDSNLAVIISATGYGSKEVNLNQDDSNAVITMQRSKAELQEVLIPARSKDAIRRNRVRLEGVAPLKGWDRLNNYISKNIKLFHTEATESFRGDEVTLSFDVDKRGNAIDILVEKPLCSSCNATAVRIIKEGSTWKKQKAGRAKAYIRF